MIRIRQNLEIDKDTPTLRRLTFRRMHVFQDKPAPPRGPRVINGILHWDKPTSMIGVTHYNIYVDSDTKLFRQVPSLQRQLNDQVTGKVFYVTSYNSITGLESTRARVIFGSGADIGPPPGTGGGAAPAPLVTINPPAEVIFRSDHKVEVDVPYTPSPNITPENYTGVAVFLEDPDISGGPNEPLTGTPLDGSTQASGQWAPIHVNDSTASPAQVFLDSTMGSTPGVTYTKPRNVRIYLASYGPNSTPMLVRANAQNPTPNIVVSIPLGPGPGNDAMEYAFLVTNARGTVTTDYNRPDPNYYLTFFYDPPDPSIPIPKGMNKFGGVRIVYVYLDNHVDAANGYPYGHPILPGTDTSINVPVAQSQTGYKSPVYTAGGGGTHFRAYFCSEDDSQPLGTHINSLHDGVTPFWEIGIPPLAPAPDVMNFKISNQRLVWRLDGSFVAEASFTWNLPSGSNSYGGVYLYLVNVTGNTPPLTPFPAPLTSQQSNADTGFLLDVFPPAHPETWTIAAISVDSNGVLADDPKLYGQAGFHSLTVTWVIGPPAPGTAGGGQEYAPLVTINSGAGVTAKESLSADGVGMVSFNIGTWTEPSSGQYGGAQAAMVVNHDPTKPTYWSVPKGNTSFVTPSMPSFGNVGSSVQVDFYIVSDDPQGHKNSLIPGTTPVIHSTYSPTEGNIIPARAGWFDPKQFAWSGSGFQAQSFSANVIQVGKTLVVGGAPSSFGGSDNGQIAVLNSSGKLLDWLGQQQPGQGNSMPLWGAWLGQVWIGGTSPLDAPIFVDNNGIIEVGGIAAAQTSNPYPYISIRDDRGYERGRIGAKLNVASGTLGDGVGSNPPLALTSGAWFQQLGIGGSSLTNWNVLVTRDPTNPLGSQFQMRNINLLSIDYPAFAGSTGQPSNNEYNLQFGNSVWHGLGATGTTSWRFPGIQIVEVDGVQNRFGAIFLNRGMVLTAPGNQSYNVLASLVMYNGQSSGADSPGNFWGELAMYSPNAPNNQTVYLASGRGDDPATAGNGWFRLADQNKNFLFEVDGHGNCFIAGTLQGMLDAQGNHTPVSAQAYNIAGFGAVIDNTGAWVGKPITGSGAQTPWKTDIFANGWSLTGAGFIYAKEYRVIGGTSPVINSSGTFLGAGVNVGTYGITCGGVTSSGPLTCTSLSASATVTGLNLTATSRIIIGANTVVDNLQNIYGHQFFAVGYDISTKPVINANGFYVGPGVQATAGSIGGTSVAIYVPSSPTSGTWYSVINGQQQFTGNGVICPRYGVQAAGFNPAAIDSTGNVVPFYGVAHTTFKTGDNKTVEVRGGVIISVA